MLPIFRTSELVLAQKVNSMKRRKQDWPSILDDMVVKAREEPFERADNDCLIWVSKTIEALTGVKTFEFFRNNYDSYREAKQRAKEFCGHPAGMRDIFDKEMSDKGFEEIDNMNMVNRGDVVLIPSGIHEGVSCGIYMDGSVYTLSPEGGLASRDLSEAICGWHI